MRCKACKQGISLRVVPVSRRLTTEQERFLFRCVLAIVIICNTEDYYCDPVLACHSDGQECIDDARQCHELPNKLSCESQKCAWVPQGEPAEALQGHCVESRFTCCTSGRPYRPILLLKNTIFCLNFSRFLCVLLQRFEQIFHPPPH